MRFAQRLLLVAVLWLPPLEAGAQDMTTTLGRLAGAWSQEDVGALQELMAPAVRLDLEGAAHLGVPPRQVAASLSRLFERYDPRALDLVRHREPGVDGEGGFAEFRWAPLTQDTGEESSYVVFAVFRRMESEWRIAELRVLR